MTQDELNEFYATFAGNDLRYENKVEEMGGTLIGQFDYDEDADVGGAYGFDRLWAILKDHNFSVLEDPASPSGDRGWVVFPPEITYG